MHGKDLNMINDNLDNNDGMEKKVCQAFLQFNNYFSLYVKEVDIDLWNRAVEFAKDSVDVPGVSLKFIDNDNIDE